MNLSKKIGLSLLSLCLTTGVIASESERLYVNISPVHYSIDKSRNSGEKDLLDMTLNEKIEEGWLYAKYKNGKEIWKDCADSQTENCAIVDFDEIHKVVKRNLEELSFYHFHPIAKDAKNEKLKKNEIYDFSQIPSNEDFQVCRLFLEKIVHSYPIHMNKFDCKLVVSTGVYTIKIDPKVIIGGKAPKFNKALNNIYHEMFFAEMGINEEFDYIITNKEKFKEMNKKFAKKFSTEVLKIDFEEK